MRRTRSSCEVLPSQQGDTIDLPKLTSLTSPLEAGKRSKTFLNVHAVYLEGRNCTVPSPLDMPALTTVQFPSSFHALLRWRVFSRSSPLPLTRRRRRLREPPHHPRSQHPRQHLHPTVTGVVRPHAHRAGHRLRLRQRPQPEGDQLLLAEAGPVHRDRESLLQVRDSLQGLQNARVEAFRRRGLVFRVREGEGRLRWAGRCVGRWRFWIRLWRIQPPAPLRRRLRRVRKPNTERSFPGQAMFSFEGAPSRRVLVLRLLQVRNR